MTPTCGIILDCNAGCWASGTGPASTKYTWCSGSASACSRVPFALHILPVVRQGQDVGSTPRVGGGGGRTWCDQVLTSTGACLVEPAFVASPHRVSFLLAGSHWGRQEGHIFFYIYVTLIRASMRFSPVISVQPGACTFLRASLSYSIVVQCSAV
jgi:hypothetical protein